MSIHACFWAAVIGILLGDVTVPFVFESEFNAKEAVSRLFAIIMFYTLILLFWDRKGKQE